MQTVDFETSLGTIPIRGLTEAFGRSHVAVLVITGAFAHPDAMIQMPLLGEGRWDGFLARLPGNETPDLSEASVAAFARAFDEVVDQLGRPVVVCGASVGALVALAMKRAKAIVALEPFLSTSGLWPLWPGLRCGLDNPGAARFIEAVFGLSASGLVDRDYRSLLDGLAAPTAVIVGGQPLLPERPWAQMPSLVSEDDRSRFADHPLVRLSVAPNTGHDVWRGAPYFVLDQLNFVASRVT